MPLKVPAVRWRACLFALVIASLALGACTESSRTLTQPESEGVALLAGRVASISYASGSTPVTAYDPIYPPVGDPNWTTTKCTPNPAVGLHDNWQNPHPAVTGLIHDWMNDWFTGAGWINAWGVPGQKPASLGPLGQSWTKYTTQVQGNGAFVIRLLADNCSWIYLDNTLVGVQNTDLSKNSYGLTLNGTHDLTFIIFDGGGLAGGKFKLETTTNPPPPLNNDLDNDGHLNDDDDFPLDPTRWKADDSPPSIVPTITGAVGSNAWYTSDVAVSWSVADAESDVTNTQGCGATSVTQDTDGVTFTCSATSAGGSASEFVTIKRDATAPVIAFSGNAGTYTVDQQVNISCAATDAMSGVASSSCPGASGAAYTFGVGAQSLSASAEDNAGNTNAASTQFTVQVTSGSLCALVSQWVSQKGVANSMCQQLKNGAYGAFRNHVSAQAGKSVSAAHAAILIALSQNL